MALSVCCASLQPFLPMGCSVSVVNRRYGMVGVALWGWGQAGTITRLWSQTRACVVSAGPLIGQRWS